MGVPVWLLFLFLGLAYLVCTSYAEASKKDVLASISCPVCGFLVEEASKYVKDNSVTSEDA
eukprot:11698884-Karenia_brevis.AAC.1